MLRRGVILEKFIKGISSLSAYIYYTGKLNMYDIDIQAETFMCDLLNVLYDMELKNANAQNRNNAVYDLISVSKKVIIQVTCSNTPEKVKSTLEKAEKLINQYTEWENELSWIKKAGI